MGRARLPACPEFRQRESPSPAAETIPQRRYGVQRGIPHAAETHSVTQESGAPRNVPDLIGLSSFAGPILTRKKLTWVAQKPGGTTRIRRI